jgi:hypothetical protein
MVMWSKWESLCSFSFPVKPQPHEILTDIEQEGYRDRGQFVLG